MSRILYILTISLIFNSICFTQDSFGNLLSEKYEWLNDSDHPGFYIGIIKSGKPIFGRSFGMSNLEHRIPFSASTVSDLGSVGKQLTVMGILLLHNQGELDIKDNIRKYLPGLSPLNEEVSIKHLIYHTSGIPDVYTLHDLKGFRRGDLISQSDAYRFINANPKVDFIPGSRYRYSNTGYMLLAEIIVNVSGSSFEEFMDKNIFTPLKMDHTYIMDRAGEIYADMAESYISDSSGNYIKLYDNSTLQGGGGVYASGYDVLKWIDNFRTQKVGNEAIFKLMLTNGILNDGSKINYASGINVDHYRGLDRYHHNGSSAGARTRLVYYPQHELGFIIKSNTPDIGYRDFNELENHIIDCYLSNHAEAIPERTVESAQQEAELLMPSNSDYSGQYHHEQLDITLKVTQNKNGIEMANFYYSFPVLKYNEVDQFSNNRYNVKFLRNNDGKIISMIMDTPRASQLEFVKKLHHDPGQ